MDLGFIELMPTAALLVDEALQAKKGENILLVTDSRIGRYPGTKQLGQAMAAAFAERGIDFNMVTFRGRNRLREDMPDATVEMIKKADAAVLLLSQSFLYTDAFRRIILEREKTRLLHLPLGQDINGTDDIFYNMPKTKEEFYAVADVGTKLETALLDKPHTLHVTAPNGTDLVFTIGKGLSKVQNGLANRPLAMTTMPCGSVALSVDFGSANGKLVFDQRFNALKDHWLVDPIELTVENGYVSKIEGGTEAALFRDLVEKAPYPREKMLQVIEFGVGFNKNAGLDGIDAGEWEQVYGAGHIGMGANVNFGGTNALPWHEDGMMANVTLESDGVLILKDGEYCLS